MKAERWLQLLLALACILGTLLLGMGENNAMLPIVMCLAAPMAFLFTDLLGWLRLNRVLANIAALTAVTYALVDFFSNGIQNQLLAIANLLLYLQLILLFQQKYRRVYWQLMVLSLLQVVVAAAMNLNIQFGALLLVYMGMAMVVLGLQFTIYEAERCLGASLASAGENGDASLFGRDSTPVTPPPPTVIRARSNTTADTAVRQVLAGRSMWSVLMIGALTLGFTAALFYSAPRLQGTQWQGGRGGGSASVGFSENVSLDEMGNILESNQLAMRVAMFNRETGEPYEMLGNPYFRGAVLTSYGEAGTPMGRWMKLTNSQPKPLPPVPTTNNRPVVLQDIWLEPMNSPVLFSVFPSYKVPGTPGEIYFDRDGGQLSRQTAAPWFGFSRFHYVIGTTGIDNGRQQVVTPVDLIPGTRDAERMERERQRCLEFDPARFPKLTQLADEVLQNGNAVGKSAGRIRKLRLLESHFHEPGRYEYSLNFPRQRRRDSDPIEIFVGETRKGHCEYFATALALMLRSQGIPSRLVVGYHGGDYNAMGGYFLVRQKDAHAWVEAYLRPEDFHEPGIVEVLGAQAGVDHPHGGWLRLDPTPGNSRDQEMAKSWFDRFEQLIDYAEFLWSDYVLELNSERQRQRVFEPFSQRLQGTTPSLLDANWWSTLLQNLALAPGGSRSAIIRGLLLRFGPGVLALLVLAALIRWRRWLPRRLRNGLDALVERWKPGGRRRRASVEFYERLETAMAQRGWRRAPGATPREFAATIEQQAQIESPQWHAALTQIIDAFYRVRFGQNTLSDADHAAIERALQLLEQAHA